MKNHIARFWIILCSALFLFGCASQPERIAQTTSGNPEVVINGVDVEAVRSKLMELMMSGGLRVDSETPSRIVVSKEMEGFREGMMRMLLGNSYSTPVRVELTFTLVKINEGVKVFAQMSAYTQMPLGQINRMDLKGNTDFNDVQKFLNQLQNQYR